jgi:hypothetical protein
MQLRVVWYLRLIGDTERPSLITGTAWRSRFLQLHLLGTPTTILTPGAGLLLHLVDLPEPTKN